MRRYDALVIGGGPNGLSAAIALARAGRSVLILEAQPRLGGALATEELTLPGFRHDTFSAVHPAAIASPVFARLPLERFGLRWVQPPVPMAHPLPGGTAVALHRAAAETAAGLDARTPGDGARWAAFEAPYLRRFPATRALLLSGFPPLAGAARLLLAQGLHGSLEFARLLLLSAENLAGELFTGAAGRAWLYGAALHGDVPPREAGSAIAGVYLLLLGHAVGWPSPEGGAGRLAEALSAYLHHLGGVWQTGRPVERIVAAAGRVRGVVAGGELFRAPLVIADLSPRTLIRLAGRALPAGYLRRLGRFRDGPATFKLDWALDGPIPWEADAVRLAGTVHVGGAASEIEAQQDEQRAGRLPERPFLLLGQQSLADPTRAPAGKHTAWAYGHVPAGLDWAGASEAQVARMEAQVERFAPGFGRRILARHVQTPDDLQRGNANLASGDVGGGSTALDQLVFRPLPGLFPYRTPLRGLYLGSASAFPGAAVHGVPGHAAARLALLESRLRRR